MLEVSPVQDRVDIDGNRLGDLVTPECGSRTVWVDDVRSPPGKIVSGRISFKLVGEMVILERSVHAQPPIPRSYCTVVGSQNTHNHDLGRKWTYDMTSDVTFRLQE